MPNQLPLLLKKKSARLTIIAGVALSLLIVINAAVSIYTLRQNTINERASELETLTLILSEHTSQTIFSANTVLDSIMDVVDLAKVETEAEYKAFASEKAQFDLLVEKTKSSNFCQSWRDRSTFGCGL